MKIHYSTIAQYGTCPHQYKLRYVDGIETIFDADPQNALVIGTALHRGVETDVETAIKEYYASYPIIDDRHVTEAMKLEYLIQEVKKAVPGGEHEVNFQTDDYEGTIDLLVPVGKGMWLDAPDGPAECDYYDIYDFKYSNNVDNYMKSAQLHLYKYFFEQANPGKRIRKLFFVFVPKCNLRIKYKNKTNPRDETIYEFRKRCMEDLKQKEIQVKEVTYDYTKVTEFLRQAVRCAKDEEYQKNPSRLCDWCNYKAFCQEGLDYMNLPKNERRNPTVAAKKKLWLYAPPFAGKTTLTDQFPDPLILTTDGNINNVTAPYVHIKDEVTVTGRITNRKFAWEVFKDTIAELEKKQNDFKTISLDLVEDTREMCRLYMYDKLGIQHESDSGFGKGWDIIKTEYLSTMRRFFNLDYDNLIICSHEDISKNLTKKSGEQITRIAPNIQEAIATKLAGMVDIVARIIVNDDGTRTISFKTDNVIFGGGRLNVVGREIPCTYDDLMGIYVEATNGGTAGKSAASSKRNGRSAERIAPAADEKPVEFSEEKTSEGTGEAMEGIEANGGEEATLEEPPKRKRRAARDEEPANDEAPADDEVSAEPVNTHRRRSRTVEVPAEDVTAIDDEGNETPLTDLVPDAKGETVTAEEAPAKEAPRRRRRRSE